MIYRLVTVWNDAEQEGAERIQRSVKDFESLQDIENFIAHAGRIGIVRNDLPDPPLPNGANLVSVFVPLNRIVGWFVWVLPDTGWPPLQPEHFDTPDRTMEGHTP